DYYCLIWHTNAWLF
nr:immunoglobulin light chain junction region [Macaca mulatta]MOX82625.1 immunoglobulin light chain junction region [Macaca mulatta]